MKKSVINCILALLLLIVTVLSVLGFRGCLSEGKGITLDTYEATLFVGETLTLTVGSENGRPMTDFAYAVEGDCVAIDENLTVTGVKEGDSTLIFTASDGSVAECRVTVVLHPESLEMVISDTDGYVGDKLELNLIATPSTAVYTYDVISSDENVISFSDGVLSFVGEGTATVTVTADNGVSVSKKIKVYPAVTFSLNGLEFDLYDHLTVITDAWGQPDSIVRLALEPDGYIYDREEGYTVIFTDGEVIKGLYTDIKSFISGDLAIGQTIGQVSRILNSDFTEGRQSVLTFRNEVWTEVFFDRLGSGSSYAVFVGGQGCSELQTPDALSLEGFAEVLFGLTNSYRRNLGLPLLKYYETLEIAALSHCSDMIENGFVGHVSSDGRTISDRINALEIKWQYSAENIAAGYTLPFAAFSGLVNSKGHRDNIISEKYMLVGISALYGEDTPYGTFVTQIFCTLF